MKTHRRIIAITTALLIVTGGAVSAAPQTPKAVVSDFQEVLIQLSAAQTRFDVLLKYLDDSREANRAYDEYKNVWLATTVAISAAAAICEYETDQLTLFLELKQKRRRLYAGVRTASLENNVRQMRLMMEQIAISDGLFPPKIEQQDLMAQIRQQMTAVIVLLGKSRELVLALEPPSGQ
ncbi:MAG: hypothetical protein ABIL58_18980 [Pseudomonadota bacterium]